MTSNYKGHTYRMRPQRERKRPNTKNKKKSDCNVALTKNLPLSRKLVYIDMKRGKHADLVEEHLVKLGARVETFLSADINYVISSFGPSKVEDVHKCSDENPNSPLNSVASPFSCIPSPSAPGAVESKKSAVSRGKTLAHLARSNHKTSTVVTNAEKMGVKVISVEVANKWMERELKKLDKDSKTEVVPEVTKSPKKNTKTKSKVLRGCFLKFEAINRHYRPVKSVLEKWPKVNLSVPPGLCPFVETRGKVKHAFGNQKLYGHKQAEKMNKAKKSFACEPKEEKSLPQSKQAQQELLATPITTAGDIKRSLSFKKNTNINKQQGYCDCCEMKFKSLEKHIRGEEHQTFARDKLNYEGLDTLISEVPSTINFLQTILLSHCIGKQKEMTGNISERDIDERHMETKVMPQLKENYECSTATITFSSGMADASTVVPLSLNAPVLCPPEISPSRDQILLASDTDQASQTDNPSQVKSSVTPNNAIGKECSDNSMDPRPQAVVIRRPVPSGIFTSPRRPRQPTPNKTPRGMERSMVFRDSPIGSLQPSPCSGSPTVSVGSIQVITPVTTTTIGASCFKKKTIPNNAFLVRAIDFTNANISSAEQINKIGLESMTVEAETFKCADMEEVVSQMGLNAKVEVSTNVQSHITTKNVVRRLPMENINNTCEILSDQLSSKDKKTSEQLRGDDLERNEIALDHKETSVAFTERKSRLSEKRLESPIVTKIVSDKLNNALNTFSIHRVNSSGVKEDSTTDGICEMINISSVSPKPKSLRNRSVTPIKVKLDDAVQMVIECKSKNFGIATQRGPEITSTYIDKGDSESYAKRCRSRSNVKKDFKSSTDKDEILKGKKTFTMVELQNLEARCDGIILDSKMDDSTSICESSKVENLNETQMSCERSLNESPHTYSNKQGMKGKKTKEKHLKCLKPEVGKTQTIEVKSPEKKETSIDKVLINSVEPKGKNTFSSKCSSSQEQVDLVNRNIEIESTEVSHVQSKRRPSRFCKQFTYKGLYANSGLGLEEANTDLSSVIVPNIAEHVKSRIRAVCLSEHLADDVYNTTQVQNIGKLKKGCGQKPGLSVKNVEYSIPSLQKTKNVEDMEGTYGNNKICDIVVPNIADCVKRRRSCTFFNHESQYANSGEGSNNEQSCSQSRRGCTVVPQRRDVSLTQPIHADSLAKIEKGKYGSERQHLPMDCTETEKLASNSYQDPSEKEFVEKSGSQQGSSNNAEQFFDGFTLFADHSKQSSNREQPVSSTTTAGKDEKVTESDKNPAVVIRRRKTLAYLPYLQKQRPDVDWGKAQEDQNSYEQVNLDMQNKSQEGQDASIQSSQVACVKKQKKLFKKKSKRKESKLSVRDSPRFDSPRLKLKLKRLPSNEGYSSVLEEYHEDQELSVFTHQNDQSKETPTAGNSINLGTFQNNTPKKECNSDVDSIDLLLSSPQMPFKRSQRKHSGMINSPRNEFDLLQVQRNLVEMKVITSLTENEDLINKNCFSDTKNKQLKFEFEQNGDELVLKTRFKSQVSKTSEADNAVAEKPKVHENVSLRQAGLEANFVDSKGMNIVKEKNKKGKRLRKTSLSTSPNKNKKAKLTGSWGTATVRKSKGCVDSEYDSAEIFHGFHESPDKDLYSDVKGVSVSDTEHEVYDRKKGPSSSDKKTAYSLRASKDQNKDDFTHLSEENLTDYLALVPTFSSPGKATDSSWGDICESYLSTTTRKGGHQSPHRPPKNPGVENRNQGIQWSVSPKKLFSDRNHHHRTVNSHGQSSAKSENFEQRGIASSGQEMPCNRTPSKRISNHHQSQSPVIHVDKVISFNMMSPQKLRSTLFQSK